MTTNTPKLINYAEFEAKHNQLRAVSAKQTREWLQQFWQKGSAGAHRQTYITAVLANHPELSADEESLLAASQGSADDRNDLVKAGFLAESHRVVIQKSENQFFGSSDEESF